MYLPIANTHINPFILISIGFFVGVLGGFFGVGGAWMVTPALNMFGFPMSYAIGTDLAHIFGKSIIATFKHKKIGNVDLKLGMLMIAGTSIGVELGKEVVIYLDSIGSVDIVVRIIYILLLSGIGSLMVYEYFRFTRVSKKEDKGDHHENLESRISKIIQDIKIPPIIHLKTSNISVSFWVITLVALITGFLSGFLGVGAGFIRMPSLVYFIGVPTKIAIGTDLFEIIFSSGIGSFLYALEGKVDLIASMIMLLGAAVGAQIGTMATKYITSMRIRLYFGYTVLLASISVALKQISQSFNMPTLGNISGYTIIAIAGTMSLIVILDLIQGKLVERQYNLRSRSNDDE